jgi:hypothetical protein
LFQLCIATFSSRPLPYFDRDSCNYV